MPRTKSDTIATLGLETFMDKRYGDGSYKKLVEAFTAGWPDYHIAQLFGLSSYQTVSNWRRAYLEEQK